LDGCVPFPFAIAEQDMSVHDGLDDNPLLKAAIEQYRRDCLVSGFDRWFAGQPSLGSGCACEHLAPSPCPFLSAHHYVNEGKFNAALRWIHTRHPCRYLGNRMDVGAWKTLLLHDLDPLWAAVVFYQICHGAVMCPIPAAVRTVPARRPPARDDPHSEVFARAVEGGVKAGDYMLWDRAQRQYPELEGREPLFINEQFALDQGDKHSSERKFRQITNMRPQSNRYCISRGARYPVLRDHIRRLIVDGEPSREQYKLDVAAGE
jgi:hypothetical protein